MSNYSIRPEGFKELIDLPGVTTIIKPAGFNADAAMPYATGCMEDRIKEILHTHTTTPNTFGDLYKIIESSRYHYKTVTQTALDTGSIVHALVECYVKTKIIPNLDNYSKEVQNGFNAFLVWEKLFTVEWLETEKTIYYFDKERGIAYAGTLDLIGIINGRVDVVDLKTSKLLFPDTMVPQLSAYKFARSNLKNTWAEIKKKNEDVYRETYTGYDIKGMGIIRLDKLTGFPEYKDYTSQYEQGLINFNHLCRYFYSAKKRRLKNNPCIRTA